MMMVMVSVSVSVAHERNDRCVIAVVATAVMPVAPAVSTAVMTPAVAATVMTTPVAAAMMAAAMAMTEGKGACCTERRRAEDNRRSD